jgi:flagellar motor protein MotB
MLGFASLFVIVVAGMVAAKGRAEPPQAKVEFEREVLPVLEADSVTVGKLTDEISIHLVYSADLLFDTCEWELSESGDRMLERHAKEIGKYAGRIAQVQILGHADSRSPERCEGLRRRDNWELSSLRAFSVRDLLLRATSIDSTKVIPVPKSSLDPLNPDDPTDRRNRRIEIFIQFINDTRARKRGWRVEVPDSTSVGETESPASATSP